MRAFRYTAYTDEGAAKKGVIIAETEAHAGDILRGKGLFPDQITAKSERTIGRRRSRLTDDLRTVFTRQMAVLLAADMPTDAALEAVRSSGTRGALDGFAADAKAAVLEGQPLSAALASADPGLPLFYTAAIRAGESSGDLGLVFEELATYLENIGTDRATIATALIYPAFVAAVSLVVCAILMINVAPEIVGMFEVSGRPLPPLTEVMMGISNWIQANWIALASGIVGFIVLFNLALRQPAFRNRFDGFMLKMPIVGRIMRMAAAAQYLRTLALIIASKQTVPDATASAAEVLTVARFRREADQVTEAVKGGQSLSDALQGLSVIPPVAMQLVNAGEASAKLARMSERAAALVENWLGNERKRFAALIDPILMMIVGAMVLVIVLSILLPIFDLQAVVGG